MDGLMGGCMDGLMGGWKSGFKDCLQQLKIWPSFLYPWQYFAKCLKLQHMNNFTKKLVQNSLINQMLYISFVIFCGNQFKDC